jgi:hypothetical protein
MTNKRGRKALQPEDKQLYINNKGVGLRRQIDLLAKQCGKVLVNDNDRRLFVVEFLNSQYKSIERIKNLNDE